MEMTKWSTVQAVSKAPTASSKSGQRLDGPWHQELAELSNEPRMPARK